MAEEDSTGSSRKRRRPRLRRRVAYRIIALLLPVLLLAVSEGILRLFGLGGYAPIIRPAGKTEKGNLIFTDPAGAATYFFANRERPGFNEQYCFYEPKAAETIRIVLVGESAIKGFP